MNANKWNPLLRMGASTLDGSNIKGNICKFEHWHSVWIGPHSVSLSLSLFLSFFLSRFLLLSVFHTGTTELISFPVSHILPLTSKFCTHRASEFLHGQQFMSPGSKKMKLRSKVSASGSIFELHMHSALTLTKLETNSAQDTAATH